MSPLGCPTDTHQLHLKYWSSCSLSATPTSQWEVSDPCQGLCYSSCGLQGEPPPSLVPTPTLLCSLLMGSQLCSNAEDAGWGQPELVVPPLAQAFLPGLGFLAEGSVEYLVSHHPLQLGSGVFLHLF
ncbi:hypothetical protein MC885_021856 [Smutsia gigantea]|nr:hypothetical protein MC885_021856 [Smutsia gigantea]